MGWDSGRREPAPRILTAEDQDGFDPRRNDNLVDPRENILNGFQVQSLLGDLAGGRNRESLAVQILDREGCAGSSVSPRCTARVSMLLDE